MRDLVRCLHCGKRLGLLRKFSGGDFCSLDHKQAFQQQQNDLALARLLESQSRMHRSTESRRTKPEPAPAGRGFNQPAPAQDPVFPEGAILPETPTSVRCDRLFEPPSPPQGLGQTGAAQPEFQARPHARGLAPSSLLDLGLAAAPAAPAPSAPEPAFDPAPALPARPSSWFRAELTVGGLFPLGPPPLLAAAFAFAQPLVCRLFPFWAPHIPKAVLPLIFQPLGQGLEDEDPVSAGLAALAAPGLLGLAPAFASGPLGWAAPAAAPGLPPLRHRAGIARPLRSEQFEDVAGHPVAAPASEPPRGIAVALGPRPAPGPGLPPLPAGGPSAAPRPGNLLPWREEPPQNMSPCEPTLSRAADPLPPGDAPHPPAHLPPARPGHLKKEEGLKSLAAGLAALHPRTAAAPPAGPLWAAPEASSLVSLGLALQAPPPPEPALEEPTPESPVLEEPAPPAPLGQLPLPVTRALSCPLAPAGLLAHYDSGQWTDSVSALALMPRARLRLAAADGSDERPKAVPQPKRAALPKLTTSPGRRIWASAPPDLKWVAVALPLILILVVYSFRTNLPKGSPTEQAAAIGGVSRTVVGGQMGSLQRVLSARAAVHLFDDFSGGLGQWDGADGWSKSWRYSPNKSLEPGPLALYSPSTPLQNYTLEFLGELNQRSLNWVIRAKDLRNYYGLRIQVVKAGPLPQANIVRYAVINGKTTQLANLPIPIPVRTGTMYRIRTEVEGNRFATYLQGNLIDSFSDDRLARGGVGFFTSKGDSASLYWIEITHQDDYLGRLCAFLAPPSNSPIQSRDKNAE